MSEIIYQKGDFTVSKFYGGKEHGQMYQLTCGAGGYVQLTIEEFDEMIRNVEFDYSNYMGVL